MKRTGQQSRGRRRGTVFSVRLTEDERGSIERLQQNGGPRALGPWLVWKALDGLPPERRDEVAPPVLDVPVEERLILDLCGGTGAWSAPYRERGYPVELVTLPKRDVRTYTPPAQVWDVLVAPPCQQFSIARNGHPELERDFVEGMACVNTCLRIVCQAKPRWWALENPVGHLSKFLGPPRDTWEPCDFGDPWTKATAIWGDYQIPVRGPFVQLLGGGPYCTVCDPTKRATVWCNNAEHRAITPPGFAQTFFRVNP